MSKAARPTLPEFTVFLKNIVPDKEGLAVLKSTVLTDHELPRLRVDESGLFQLEPFWLHSHSWVPLDTFAAAYVIMNPERPAALLSWIVKVIGPDPRFPP